MIYLTIYLFIRVPLLSIRWISDSWDSKIWRLKFGSAKNLWQWAKHLIDHATVWQYLLAMFPTNSAWPSLYVSYSFSRNYRVTKSLLTVIDDYTFTMLYWSSEIQNSVKLDQSLIRALLNKSWYFHDSGLYTKLKYTLVR